MESGTAFGLDVSVSLLDILVPSDDLETAATAVARLVAVSRALSEATDEAAESLRLMATALDELGRIRRMQGDQAGALEAFEESLGLARRIDERWGPTPESLRDLSVSLDNVGRIRQMQADEPGA